MNHNSLAALLTPLTLGSQQTLSDGGLFTLRNVNVGGGLSLWLDSHWGGVRVDVFPLEGASTEQSPAASTSTLGLSYRPPLGMPSRVGEALCENLAEVIGPNEAAVMESLRRSGGQTRLRESRGGPLLARLGGDERPFYGLDPYVGCLIGCKFCYVQGRAQSWREALGLRDAAWGSWADVRVDAPETLAKELDALPPLPIKLSPIVTDPYQPLERRYEVTRRCLQVLVDRGYVEPVIVLTRSALVLRDVELLLQLPSVWVGMSVPTLDDATRERLEPRAASIPERLSTLARLKEAGLRTFAVVQPMLPGSPTELAAALAPVVESATLDTLHGVYGASATFEHAELRHAVSAAWQQRQLEVTVTALAERGVTLWRGEIPPSVTLGR